MKICIRCSESKSPDEFYKDSRRKDGLYSHCKKCHNKYYITNREEIRAKQAKHYQDNRERLLNKQKAYSQSHKNDKAKYDSEYRNRNIDKIKSRLVEYHKSEHGRKTINNASKRHLKIPDNKYKHKVRTTVNNAVKQGKIPRASTLKCTHCPNQAQEYHHYLGYEREHWFDIEPVCIPCHNKLD